MTNSVKDWVQKFNESLKDVALNKDLAEHIQDYLNGQNYTSKAIDKLLMAITKLVETNLRDAVQRFTGAKVPSTHNHGVDLLNYAKNKGMIPEPRS